MRIEGVIVPPPEIRAVVDKTAQFVARIGKSFEQKVLNSADGKAAKFNFLKSHDPYNAYYEMKIRESEGAPVTSTTSEVPIQKFNERSPLSKPESQDQCQSFDLTHSFCSLPFSSGVTKAALSNPLSRFSISSKLSSSSSSSSSEVETPDAHEFCSGHPSGLATQDTDMIKLTAQYTAMNGREFLGEVAQREQRNPQFDFLKPTHLLFGYFTFLVDSYSRILQPLPKLCNVIRLKRSRFCCLSKALHAWEWKNHEEEFRKSENSVPDKDNAYASIDWCDFSVVESIEFSTDELTSVEVVSEVLKEEHILPDQNSSQINDVESVENTSLRNGELNVISGVDYEPRIGGLTPSSTPIVMVDPISGRNIPVDQVTEHMRVQLMDPKWMIQQRRFIDKQVDSGYAVGSSIADSLKDFAQKRVDIFGSVSSNKAIKSISDGSSSGGTVRGSKFDLKRSRDSDESL